MYQSPLSLWLFEPFLRDLKIELGYPEDIGKLKQLVEWSSLEYAQKGILSLDRVYRVCRLLYLQNPKEHGNIFEALFKKHILTIEEWCNEFRENLSTPDIDRKEEQSDSIQSQADYKNFKKKAENQPVKQENNNIKQKNEDNDKENTQKPVNSPSHISEPHDEKKIENVKTFKYLNMEMITESVESSPKTSGGAFVLNDAFLPITRREIVHAWRYLRVKDRSKDSSMLDISATVVHIAKNRIPDRLIFQQKPVNGENLLTIFVDRGGSMTPFHHLTDVIIQNALIDGGHKMAKVYYYYNVPSNYVYEEPSLSKPILLSKVYAKLSPSRTTVLIISDGGAMRGKRSEIRLKKTLAFLNGSDRSAMEGLQKRVRSIAWLNPMPVHRWHGTSVMDTLRHSGIPMFSILDLGKDSLLQAVRSLMGKL